MFHKRNVKNGSKDLKKYPQISRRVRDTLARLIDGQSMVVHAFTAAGDRR